MRSTQCIGDSHPRAQNFIVPRVERLEALQLPASTEYQRIFQRCGDFHANTWLREVHDLVKPFFSGTIVKDIDTICLALAGRFGSVIRWAISTGDKAVVDRVEAQVKQFLVTLGLPFPKAKKIESSLARLEHVKWWRKQINKAIPRIVDQVSRKLGHVHQSNDCYLSESAFVLQQNRMKSNQRYLEAMEATNDVGQRYTLAELAKKSISVAVNKRTELLVRCRGAEERALEIGYDTSLFVTVTAPSKYHGFSQNGVLNKKWNLADPREVNAYLNAIWSRIRSEFARKGIKFFGVRVAEPHHDGTPHWHILLFTNAARKDVVAILLKHGLADDGSERGAKIHRVKIETIQESKGSATGYIAKYISKNIDGYGVELDNYGNTASKSAARITAWSRVWGIRQFQFFGMASVTVYRELRRVRRVVPSPYENARKAADGANYNTFCREMDLHHIKLFREPYVNIETGETVSPYNAYGELKPMPVKGVQAAPKTPNGALLAVECIPLITRWFNWTITKGADAFDLKSVAPWTCVNNCTGIDNLIDATAYHAYRGPPVSH